MELHPQVIARAGKQEFIVLSYQEFLWLQEQLENGKNLKALRELKIEETVLLSEKSLAECWDNEEENEAWKDL